MYLLSQYGERHEDRLPEGIFSSLDKIREFLKIEDSFIEEILITTDYNDSAIEFRVISSSKEEYEKLSLEAQNSVDCEVYVAEQFELDADDYENVESKIFEISPVENFEDLIIRRNFKNSILETIELAQKTDIRGISPFTIRCWLEKGSEIQIRELLSEMVKDSEIISTGQTLDKKYSVIKLSEKAKAQYEKECDARKRLILKFKVD